MNQCLDKRKADLGVNHPDTLVTMNNLAMSYHRQGKYRDAEVLYRECLDKMNIVLGESHPSTVMTVDIANDLARILSLH